MGVGQYLDACTTALAHSIWHSCSGWINHRHEPHKAELLCGKVQLIRVKLEAPRKLSRRQVQLTEAWGGAGGRRESSRVAV